MTAFKEMLKRDVTSVFLNLDEFAETHALAIGQTDYGDISCVVDTSVTQDEKEYTGLFKSILTIYVNDTVIGKHVVGEEVVLDGDLLILNNISHETGMFVLTCEIYRD